MQDIDRIYPPCHALTRASSSVENGNANSAAPGTTSSLVSAPNARTSLAVQRKEIEEVQINRSHAISCASAMPHLTVNEFIFLLQMI